MAAAGDTEAPGTREMPLQISNFVMFAQRELFSRKVLIAGSGIDRQFQTQRAD